MKQNQFLTEFKLKRYEYLGILEYMVDQTRSERLTHHAIDCNIYKLGDKMIV